MFAIIVQIAPIFILIATIGIVVGIVVGVFFLIGFLLKKIKSIDVDKKKR